MRSIRRRLIAVVVATGIAALAAPVSGASAFVWPSGGAVLGYPQAGYGGCEVSNRPQFGGDNGRISNHICGAVLSFVGPQIGQISSLVGPTIIGSPDVSVIMSNGPITGVVP